MGMEKLKALLVLKMGKSWKRAQSEAQEYLKQEAEALEAYLLAKQVAGLDAIVAKSLGTIIRLLRWEGVVITDDMIDEIIGFLKNNQSIDTIVNKMKQQPRPKKSSTSKMK